MAPRTAKTKKNADVKVSENDAPKKGRGRAKNVAEPDPESVELENEKVSVIEKKTKRGNKNFNKNVENNEELKEAAPVKKGRKKNVEEAVADSKENGDTSDENTEEVNEESEGSVEPNGHSEEVQVPSKGRAKKNAKKEVKPKESAKGRKNAKQEEIVDKEEATEDKPKGRGRARKAQTKPDPEPEEEDIKEDEKPVAKGRKRGKAQDKVAEEKPQDEEMEVEAETQTNDQDDDDKEEEPEPKRKETKGRKNVKKASPKDDSEDKDDIKDELPPAKKRKGAKNDEKGKGDTKEIEKDVTEVKPKGKRGQKKAEKPEADEVEDTGEPTTKRRRKADEKVSEEDNKKPNKSGTDYESIDFSNSSTNAQGKEWNFKIACWNVDGIRAWMGKKGLEYLKYEKPDILCLQEIKCSQDKLPEELKNVPGYHSYWLPSDKDGYAGVGIYTTKLAINVTYGLQDEELDSEGRIITAEYEQFYLICTYVPNAGRKLVTLPKRLKWNEEFRKHVKSLDKSKPVIICGDMNVAHNEIDLTNPKTNKKNAGFTEEERAGMTELLGDGFVDTFRHFYPDKTGAYTFWSNMSNSRAKNVGWRLDYFIVSERLLPIVCDNVIRDKVFGSDHCPISLYLHLTTANKPKEES